MSVATGGMKRWDITQPRMLAFPKRNLNRASAYPPSVPSEVAIAAAPSANMMLLRSALLVSGHTTTSSLCQFPRVGWNWMNGRKVISSESIRPLNDVIAAQMNGNRMITTIATTATVPSSLRSHRPVS